MAATGAIAALEQRKKRKRKRENEEKKLKLLERQLCPKCKKVFAEIFEQSKK